MITLKIKNWFQKDRDYKETDDGRFYQVNNSETSYLKPYDEEKWKDGKTYEFETLKDLVHFCDSCEIEFTDDILNAATDWNWDVLEKKFHIDDSEDNLVIFEIFMYEEWRD